VYVMHGGGGLAGHVHARAVHVQLCAREEVSEHVPNAGHVLNANPDVVEGSGGVDGSKQDEQVLLACLLCGSSKLGVSCKFLLKSCGEVGGGDVALCGTAAGVVETAVNPE